jgi:hypothetical protein
MNNRAWLVCLKKKNQSVNSSPDVGLEFLRQIHGSGVLDVETKASLISHPEIIQ